MQLLSFIFIFVSNKVKFNWDKNKAQKGSNFKGI